MRNYPKPSYKKLLGLALTVLMLFAVGAASTQASEETGNGLYTAEQAERGQEAYEKHCSSCHGAELEGSGHFPPLTGDRFWRRWEGRTAWELYEFTHDNMPLGQGGSLPEESYADILAFQLAHYGYPEGEAALVPDEEGLAEIILEPQQDEGEDD
ncbi:MAG: c-type cytochrome [Deinococcota bacterium]|nr:c-type cytochrome [Deinococcota bacterium]